MRMRGGVINSAFSHSINFAFAVVLFHECRAVSSCDAVPVPDDDFCLCHTESLTHGTASRQCREAVSLLLFLVFFSAFVYGYCDCSACASGTHEEDVSITPHVRLVGVSDSAHFVVHYFFFLGGGGGGGLLPLQKRVTNPLCQWWAPCTFLSPQNRVAIPIVTPVLLSCRRPGRSCDFPLPGWGLPWG